MNKSLWQILENLLKAFVYISEKLFHQRQKIFFEIAFDNDIGAEVFMQVSAVCIALFQAADTKGVHLDTCGDFASAVSDNEHVFSVGTEGF